MDAGDPRGAIVAAMELMYAIALPLLILNVPVYVAHFWAARGTKIRYLTGAIIPVMCLAGCTAFGCRLVGDILAERAWWHWVFDLFCIASWTFNWYSWKHTRDDDDFWSSFGGRLKRGIRRLRITILRPVGVTR